MILIEKKHNNKNAAFLYYQSSNDCFLYIGYEFTKNCVFSDFCVDNLSFNDKVFLDIKEFLFYKTQSDGEFRFANNTYYDVINIVR